MCILPWRPSGTGLAGSLWASHFSLGLCFPAGEGVIMKPRVRHVKWIIVYGILIIFYILHIR